jgi:hypothetical protein
MVAICLQSALDSKAPKKSPLALRMVVLAITVLCGLFICSMCMKQLGSDSRSRIVKIEVAEQPCNKSAVLSSEVQFVHYPQPVTYSRWTLCCSQFKRIYRWSLIIVLFAGMNACVTLSGSLQLSRHSDLEVAGLKPFLTATLMLAPTVKFSLINRGEVTLHL